VDAAPSGQFLSALLIAGAARGGGLAVSATGVIASAPYVRLTAAMLREFGHSVEESGGAFRVMRGRAAIRRYEPPGDWSSAVPILAAAAIAGGEARVEGVAWPSGDADAAAAGVLESMGVAVSGSAGGVTAAARRGSLLAVSVSAADFPDAVPALAACAAFASGESRFTGIGHLRIKESDRIDALVAILRAAGVDARGEADALAVRGGAAPQPGPLRLPTRNDHRIAMAAGLLALAVPGVLIENPSCVAKSYPGFWRDLDSIAVRR
jgi:3-phosphoshikimate 1-carboxyvinyltransferase